MQIDTINVIERCHHHILFSRIPALWPRPPPAGAKHRQIGVRVLDPRAGLRADPRPELLPAGDEGAPQESAALEQAVDQKDYRRVIRLIRADGPITIRDIDDDELVEKEHPWASRKPSKAALQRAFWDGVLTISSASACSRPTS